MCYHNRRQLQRIEFRFDLIKTHVAFVGCLAAEYVNMCVLILQLIRGGGLVCATY